MTDAQVGAAVRKSADNLFAQLDKPEQLAKIAHMIIMALAATAIKMNADTFTLTSEIFNKSDGKDLGTWKMTLKRTRAPLK